jgi:single-strand selective monofunctional uracil DNA glycosylase
MVEKNRVDGYAGGMELVSISRNLRKRVDALRFAAPVAYVYNPLAYAREPHEQYLSRYGSGKKDVLLVGMNPGPFGMAQTGVPFGDVALVSGFLGISAPVGKPALEHPKRPIEGFSCGRSEVSGTRLWGWVERRFRTPEAFFERFFVYNYCPLAFMEASGKNRTPDKLPSTERSALYEVCDQALRQVCDSLNPRWVIGVGTFGETRAREALGASSKVEIGNILHPSPASPKANRGWADLAEGQLRRHGIPLPE